MAGDDMKILAAFTLIEMIIVIAVIGILSGLTVSSYRVSSETRNLEGESRKLADFFGLAYKKGYAAETGNLAQCSDFRGYQVTLTPGSRQYSLTRCCNATCSGAQSVTIASHTLRSPNVTFTAPAGTTTYLFRPLSLQTVTNPPANTTITLRNAAVGKCVTLTVGTAGSIQENAQVNC